jgi:hypothetical protein
MWAHYRKTFWTMQLMMFLVAVAVFFATPHLWIAAGTFLVIMQLGAVVGAAWAARLKQKLQRSPS